MLICIFDADKYNKFSLRYLMCFLASKCMHTHVGDRVLDERQPSLISSELPLWKDRHSEKGEGGGTGGGR